MGQTERRLAKMFFFFALQGIRRQYPKVETAFVAHAAKAWEFTEAQFFEASGTGGTVSSTAFELACKLVQERFDPARYNVFLFYASDGDNLIADHCAAAAALRTLCSCLNYGGLIEVRQGYGVSRSTDMANVFAELQHEHLPLGIAQVAGQEDVWGALRAFFRQEETCDR